MKVSSKTEITAEQAVQLYCRAVARTGAEPQQPSADPNSDENYFYLENINGPLGKVDINTGEVKLS